MKRFVFIFSFFLFFFLVSETVFAHDLEVNCGASVCQLSSNDPVFPPGIVWPPNEKQVKSILIKNTDKAPKKIFLKATRKEGVGQIDEYISINLNDDSSQIWSGTLSQFLEGGEYSLGSILPSNDAVLTVTAKISGDIPNDLQGGVSSFDFGFGFEGDSSNNNNSNNNLDNNSNSNSDTSSLSSNNSSNSESENTNTETGAGAQVVGIIPFINNTFGNVFGAFADNSSSEAVDERTFIEEKDSEDVLGAGDQACRENYLWVVFIILQVLFSILLFSPKIKDKLKLFLTGHSILFGSSVIAIYFLSCYLWPILISAGVYILPIVLLLSKKKMSDRQSLN